MPYYFRVLPFLFKKVLIMNKIKNNSIKVRLFKRVIIIIKVKILKQISPDKLKIIIIINQYFSIEKINLNVIGPA